jgi:hypothetical protein
MAFKQLGILLLVIVASEYILMNLESVVCWGKSVEEKERNWNQSFHRSTSPSRLHNTIRTLCVESGMKSKQQHAYIIIYVFWAISSVGEKRNDEEIVVKNTKKETSKMIVSFLKILSMFFRYPILFLIFLFSLSPSSSSSYTLVGIFRLHSSNLFLNTKMKKTLYESSMQKYVEWSTLKMNGLLWRGSFKHEIVLRNSSFEQVSSYIFSIFLPLPRLTSSQSQIK